MSKKCQKALSEAKQIIKVLDDENNGYSFLDKVDYPSDLKKFNDNELELLADNIRNYILDVISKTGGHLAAGLGTVELSISLHHTFDTPRDKLFGILATNVIRIRYSLGEKEIAYNKKI